MSTMITDFQQNYKQSQNISDSFVIPEKWVTSAIDTELARANCTILDYGDTAEFLWGKDYAPERTNAGRITAKKDWFISEGAMVWQPINPETGKKSTWGVVKPFPVSSALGVEKGFPVVPTGSKNHPFVFEVPDGIWEKIAAKSGIVRGEYTNFWQWVRENPVPVALTEGPEKAASLLSAGYAAVGFNGIWGFNDTESPLPAEDRPLHPWLQWILGAQDRKITITFDKDQKRETQEKVRQATLKLLGKLSGYYRLEKIETTPNNLLIANWDSSLGKGIDDVAFNHGYDAVDAIFSSAKTFGVTAFFDTFHISYPIIYKGNDRYLDPDKMPKSAKKIKGLHATKGCGKTTFLNKIVAELQSQNKRFAVIPIVSVGHRERLQKELAEKLYLDFVNDIKHGYEWAYSREYGCALVIDSLCPESRTKIDFFESPNLFDNAVVILDETEQLLTHLIESDTLKTKRASIFEQFCELLKRAKEIWLSDADLSDFAIDFVRKVSGCGLGDVDIYQNLNIKSDSWTTKILTDKDPTGLLVFIEDLLKQGEKVFLLTGSQKPSSKYAARNLAQYFEKAVNDLGGFIEVRDSMSQESFKLNEVPENCLLLIATPVIETGVDITAKHFTHVCAIFSEVQSIQSCCQALARIRYNAPRTFWAKAKNNSIKLGGATSYKQAKFFAQSKFEEFKKAYPNWEIFNNDSEESRAFEEFYFRNIVRWNLGCQSFRELIAEFLKKDGHNIEFCEFGTSKEVKSQIDAICTENWTKERAEINNQPMPTKTRMDALKTKRGKTPEENREYERGRIEATYGYCDEELIEADKDGCYAALKLRFYLTNYTGIRDEKIRRDNTGKKQVLAHKIAEDVYLPKVRFLDELKIGELLEKGLTEKFTTADFEFFSNCEYMKSARYFGALGSVMPVSPIVRARSILKKLGYTLKRSKDRQGGGKRLWYYTIDDDFKFLAMAPASASDTPLLAEAKTNYEVITAHWVARDCEIETNHLEHLAKEAEKAAQKAEQEAQKAAQKAEQISLNKRPSQNAPKIAQTPAQQGFEGVPNSLYNIYYRNNFSPSDVNGSAGAQVVTQESDVLDSLKSQGGSPVPNALTITCITPEIDEDFTNMVAACEGETECLMAVWGAVKSLGDRAIEYFADKFGDILERLDPATYARFAF